MEHLYIASSSLFFHFFSFLKQSNCMSLYSFYYYGFLSRNATINGLFCDMGVLRNEVTWDTNDFGYMFNGSKQNRVLDVFVGSKHTLMCLILDWELECARNIESMLLMNG